MLVKVFALEALFLIVWVDSVENVHLNANIVIPLANAQVVLMDISYLSKYVLENVLKENTQIHKP